MISYCQEIDKSKAPKTYKLFPILLMSHKTLLMFINNIVQTN